MKNANTEEIEGKFLDLGNYISVCVRVEFKVYGLWCRRLLSEARDS